MPALDGSWLRGGAGGIGQPSGSKIFNCGSVRVIRIFRDAFDCDAPEHRKCDQQHQHTYQLEDAQDRCDSKPSSTAIARVELAALM